MPAGRPKRSPLESIKTHAWMAWVMETSGQTSAYGVAKLFDATQEKRFDKYRRGVVSPNITTLKLAERQFPGTRRIYTEGPTRRVPLWPTMEGTVEEAWRSLVVYDPTFEAMRLIGTEFAARAAYLTETRLGVTAKGDLMAWQKGLAKNAVTLHFDDQIAKGTLAFTLDDLAAVIALWRTSMFAGAATMELRYFLMGLYPNVLPQLLKPWQIEATEFIHHLDVLERADVLRNADIAPLPVADPAKPPTGW